MTDGGRRRPRGAWLWLPVTTSAVLVPVMYGVGRASDPRSERAGAEPGMAGLLVAVLLVPLVPAWVAHARRDA